MGKLPVRVRFAATCHNTGQADAEKFTLLLSGKISDFYATYQMKKAVKRFRNGVLYDLLKLLCVSGRGILPKWGVRKAKEV